MAVIGTLWCPECPRGSLGKHHSRTSERLRARAYLAPRAVPTRISSPEPEADPTWQVPASTVPQALYRPRQASSGSARAQLSIGKGERMGTLRQLASANLEILSYSHGWNTVMRCIGCAVIQICARLRQPALPKRSYLGMQSDCRI
jgi:hypothetical protein